ncbi:phosphoribosylglycinamide formyltransferase [Terrihabitans soli]|uniref:Phosphoribosylglycinamide formyltransferase n=1 Tax=Terrihabitans soli TaxID=708113 RepID=A0A6S6QN88_9HYPH|nr:phosphoribosylglycinamide formyltransferase [Terrihabitans soli]BCJ90866.1 phosphoribosylglycinamide formyltransferase [Terrihabitans soli]
MKKIRTAIMISGGGSNMAALIEAARAQDYPAEIVCVIASNLSAGGIAKAKAAGIPAFAFDHKLYDREGLERLVHTELEKAGVELVCLAGWMRLLSPFLIGAWHNRMINIHPSLLPKYKGLHTHKRAIEAGDKEHGCTVHYVRQAVDDGPIIAQASVPVLAGDTEDVLAARVLVQEHKLYPHALALVGSGRVRVTGDEIAVQPGTATFFRG